MIVCVTPNAALDRTLHVSGFSTDGVFRSQNVLVDAGGKGINVARAVQILGGEARCCGFLGGHTGQQIAALVEADGVAACWTALADGESRTCVIIADPDAGTSAVINAAGPRVSASDWDRLYQDILACSEGASTICFCGSLPPASPLDTFREVLAALLQTGRSVWIDTSGDALAAAATVPGLSLKVNAEEAVALLGRQIKTLDDAGAVADRIYQQVAAPVVLTHGGQGGVFVGAEGRWRAVPPPIDLVSTVGSGDAFLAGLLFALERGIEAPEALRHAVAAGAANAQALGGAHFSSEDFAQLLARTTAQTLS